MEAEFDRVYSREHTLTWSLLMLQAMHKCGLAPCDNRRFHRLIYFGNTLARLYDFQPPAEVVMRLPAGPFYPQAQFDLDRLCVTGMAEIRDYRLERSDKIVERRGTYDISGQGFRVADGIRGDSGWASVAGEVVFDLCVAYSNVGEEFHAEDRDFTYQSPSTEVAPVFNFRDVRRNLTLRVTRDLQNAPPPELRPIPQHALRIYLRYLERLAA